jgi:hypothetical protein
MKDKLPIGFICWLKKGTFLQNASLPPLALKMV